MMRLICIAVSTCLAGCATLGIGAKYIPLVDMQGRDPIAFEADLATCQSFAASQERAAAFAVIGAVTFGVVGALLTARGYRNEVAPKLAAVGAAAGAADGIGTQQEIIKRCLAGRGYSVLN